MSSSVKGSGNGGRPHLLCGTLEPDNRRVTRTIVIIVIIWIITTFRYGPGWVTPAEVAFFALILNPSAVQSSSRQLLKGA
jgi:hypothetical protein